MSSERRVCKETEGCCWWWWWGGGVLGATVAETNCGRNKLNWTNLARLYPGQMAQLQEVCAHGVSSEAWFFFFFYVLREMMAVKDRPGVTGGVMSGPFVSAAAEAQVYLLLKSLQPQQPPPSPSPLPRHSPRVMRWPAARVPTSRSRWQISSTYIKACRSSEICTVWQPHRER